MNWFIAKTIVAAILISLSSTLMERYPSLAGFLIALPLSSALALAFGQIQFQDASQSVAFARSIFLAIPLSLTFFVPFLLAHRLQWGFWALYSAGVGLLGVSYLVFRHLRPEG